jgi:hypothetical protein
VGALLRAGCGMTGHTVFRPGEKSPCPEHKGFCAYTGTEPDRCAHCHRPWHLIEECARTGCGDCQRCLKLQDGPV